jgi:hypothetical protein
MVYRYTLKREWLGAGGMVNWIMLNPSTADDFFDDPTIRKCIGFSKRWSFSSMEVTNLFAMRATDPTELLRVSPASAIGPDNDASILTTARRASMICAAWGNHGGIYRRGQEVLEVLRNVNHVACIGVTKLGMPVHPGRVGYTNAPVPYCRMDAAS